ncbi:hypothetical protein ACEPAF_314 [Sanghuangporus sanghuang]
MSMISPITLLGGSVVSSSHERIPLFALAQTATARGLKRDRTRMRIEYMLSRLVIGMTLYGAKVYEAGISAILGECDSLWNEESTSAPGAQAYIQEQSPPPSRASSHPAPGISPVVPEHPPASDDGLSDGGSNEDAEFENSRALVRDTKVTPKEWERMLKETTDETTYLHRRLLSAIRQTLVDDMKGVNLLGDGSAMVDGVLRDAYSQVQNNSGKPYRLKPIKLASWSRIPVGAPLEPSSKRMADNDGDDNSRPSKHIRTGEESSKATSRRRKAGHKKHKSAKMVVDDDASSNGEEEGGGEEVVDEERRADVERPAESQGDADVHEEEIVANVGGSTGNGRHTLASAALVESNETGSQASASLPVPNVYGQATDLEWRSWAIPKRVLARRIKALMRDTSYQTAPYATVQVYLIDQWENLKILEQCSTFRSGHILIKRHGRDLEAFDGRVRCGMREAFDTEAPISANETEVGENLFKQVRGNYRDFARATEVDEKSWNEALKKYREDMKKWEKDRAEYEDKLAAYNASMKEGRTSAKPWKRPSKPAKLRAEPKIDELSHLRPLNFLDMPLSGDVFERPLDDSSKFFARQSFVRDSKLYVFSTPCPPEQFGKSWLLASIRSAWSDWHIDTAGMATALHVIDGRKLIFIPRDFRLFPAGWQEERDGRLACDAVLLERGDTFLMKPGTSHFVVTLVHSTVIGAHFYSLSSMKEMLVGLLRVHYLGRTSTNVLHNTSPIMLAKCLASLAERCGSGTPPDAEGRVGLGKPKVALKGATNEDLAYLLIINAHIDQLQPECCPDDTDAWQKTREFALDYPLIRGALRCVVDRMEEAASDALMSAEDEFFRIVKDFEVRLAKEVGNSWANDGRSIKHPTADTSTADAPQLLPGPRFGFSYTCFWQPAQAEVLKRPSAAEPVLRSRGSASHLGGVLCTAEPMPLSWGGAGTLRPSASHLGGALCAAEPMSLSWGGAGTPRPSAIQPGGVLRTAEPMPLSWGGADTPRSSARHLGGVLHTAEPMSLSWGSTGAPRPYASQLEGMLCTAEPVPLSQGGIAAPWPSVEMAAGTSIKSKAAGAGQRDESSTSPQASVIKPACQSEGALRLGLQASLRAPGLPGEQLIPQGLEELAEVPSPSIASKRKNRPRGRASREKHVKRHSLAQHSPSPGSQPTFNTPASPKPEGHYRGSIGAPLGDPVLSAQEYVVDLDVHHLQGTGPGWIGLGDSTGPEVTSLDGSEIKRLVEHEGWRYIPNDPRRAQVLLDRGRRVFAVKARTPNNWDRTVTGVEKAMDEFSSAINLGNKDLFNHRRGEFPSFVFGDAAHGGGRSQPATVKVKDSRVEALQKFQNDASVEHYLGFVSSTFKTWFPLISELYEREKRCTASHNSITASALLKSQFSSMALNLGGEVATCWHRDAKNLSFGLCCVGVFGCFDWRNSGQLMFKEAKVIIELRPGDVVLFPSAALTHRNAPIANDSSRRSVVLFTAGANFQHIAQGHKTAGCPHSQGRRALSQLSLEPFVEDAQLALQHEPLSRHHITYEEFSLWTTFMWLEFRLGTFQPASLAAFSIYTALRTTAIQEAPPVIRDYLVHALALRFASAYYKGLLLHLQAYLILIIAKPRKLRQLAGAAAQQPESRIGNQEKLHSAPLAYQRTTRSRGQLPSPEYLEEHATALEGSRATAIEEVALQQGEGFQTNLQGCSEPQPSLCNHSDSQIEDFRQDSATFYDDGGGQRDDERTSEDEVKDQDEAEKDSGENSSKDSSSSEDGCGSDDGGGSDGGSGSYHKGKGAEEAYSTDNSDWEAVQNKGR